MLKNKQKLYFFAILTLALIASCTSQEVRTAMNNTKAVMETRPDSALSLLEGIDKSSLHSKEARAEYALLMSMALDKNYIDTTSFDVLQPAIDYYLKKGTPQDKFLTYYYQGRIYQNRNDLGKAMESLCAGMAVENIDTCSITYGRALSLLATMHFDLYDMDGYIVNNLKAARVFRQLSNKDNEFESLTRALFGTVCLKRRLLSDSILEICNRIQPLTEEQQKTLNKRRLSYLIEFGKKSDLQQQLNNSGFVAESNRDICDLANAYNTVGDYEQARELLDYVNANGLEYDTLRYLSLSVTALKGFGEYKEALLKYEHFNQLSDSIDNYKFYNQNKLIEAKVTAEFTANEIAREHRMYLWIWTGIIILVILILTLLILGIRQHKIQKLLAIEQAKFAEAEKERIKSDNEKLALEKENLRIEYVNKTLEAENLANRIEALQSEQQCLKQIIDRQDNISNEVREAIKVRVTMLNSLLASYITDNDQYCRPYNDWIDQLAKDTQQFMNSNRLAFKASHPEFIQFFEKHGLDEDEINYICLYAIGLRGKEVGNYIKKRSHTNVSSTIRRKLGIDKHETNIGIYVRRLLARS